LPKTHEALSRGNSKTEGFKSRILPIGGRISRALTLGNKRKELHELAKVQIGEIDKFDKALRTALACIIREGTAEGVLGDMRSPKALLAA
jgi:CRISPR system Cascade subunit CasA